MSNKQNCRQFLITQIISNQLVLSLNIKKKIVHLYCFELCWLVIYKTGINDI